VSDEKEKLDLSISQLAIGAASTITVTWLSATLLPPGGTMIAGACTSVLSTSVSAVYKHGWHRTATRLKTVTTKERRQVDPNDTVIDNIGNYMVTEKKTFRVPNWKVLAGTGIAAAGAFISMLVLNTGAEAAAGKPVSAIVQNKPGSGTSLFGGHTSPRPTSTPTVTPNPTIRKSTESTPTPGPTQTTTRPTTSSIPKAPVSVPPVPAPTSTQPEPEPTG
jgi:hypothetical protein